jgi:hypothetical protein
MDISYLLHSGGEVDPTDRVETPIQMRPPLTTELDIIFSLKKLPGTSTSWATMFALNLPVQMIIDRARLYVCPRKR